MRIRLDSSTRASTERLDGWCLLAVSLVEELKLCVSRDAVRFCLRRNKGGSDKGIPDTPLWPPLSPQHIHSTPPNTQPTWIMKKCVHDLKMDALAANTSRAKFKVQRLVRSLS